MHIVFKIEIIQWNITINTKKDGFGDGTQYVDEEDEQADLD
jgi:hypothetical protein